MARFTTDSTSTSHPAWIETCHGLCFERGNTTLGGHTLQIVNTLEIACIALPSNSSPVGRLFGYDQMVEGRSRARLGIPYRNLNSIAWIELPSVLAVGAVETGNVDF